MCVSTFFCFVAIGPVLLAPPTVVSVSHTNVILRLDNIATIGDKTADSFQIEYKVNNINSTGHNDPYSVS